MVAFGDDSARPLIMFMFTFLQWIIPPATISLRKMQLSGLKVKHIKHPPQL